MISIALASLLCVVSEPDPILWSVDVSPDGAVVATSGEPTGWLYDAATLEPDDRGDGLPSASAMAVAFHPVEPVLGVSGYDGLTGLYNMDTGIFTPLPTEGARGIDFNYDGSLVAVAGNDGAVLVWDIDGIAVEPKLVYRDRPDGSKSLTGVAWHPSKNKLVAIGEFITVHDLADDEPAVPVRNPHRPGLAEFSLPLGVDWHPSGKFFVVSDYGYAEVGIAPALEFRSSDGKLIKSIERKGAEIRNVRWSPDGSKLAAASDRLVIYTSEGVLKHESELDEPLEGDESGNLWGLAWSPGGTAIYTTDMSGRAMRWDADATNSVFFGQ